MIYSNLFYILKSNNFDTISLLSVLNRGKAWDCYENVSLSRACIAASEGLNIGVNQTSKHFWASLQGSFIKLGPTNEDVDKGRFGDWYVAGIRQHFSDISADVQKFGGAVMRFSASKPMGFVSEGILATAVAVHLKRQQKFNMHIRILTKIRG